MSSYEPPKRETFQWQTGVKVMRPEMYVRMAGLDLSAIKGRHSAPARIHEEVVSMIDEMLQVAYPSIKIDSRNETADILGISGMAGRVVTRRTTTLSFTLYEAVDRFSRRNGQGGHMERILHELSGMGYVDVDFHQDYDAMRDYERLRFDVESSHPLVIERTQYLDNIRSGREEQRELERQRAAEAAQAKREAAERVLRERMAAYEEEALF